MNLKVLSPYEVILEQKVNKVVAEGIEGYFCLLPRHIDYVSTLKASILGYTDLEDNSHYVAVNEGVLTKCGSLVTVSTLNAIEGDSLEELRQKVLTEFIKVDDVEKEVKTALASLELQMFKELMKVKRR